MGERIEKIKTVIKNDKKILVILILAVLGIVILIISEFAGVSEKSDVTKSQNTSEEYAEVIEKKLSEIITSIDGAGKTKVMVTVETGEENVFAKEVKTSEENDEKENRTDYEYEYVVIKNGTSSENGMLLKVIEPDIRGVAVVCSGGDNAAVKENIINTVSAVLDIKTNKISVCKMQGWQEALIWDLL